MRTRLRVVVPGGVLLGGLDGEVEDPGARVYLGRSSPHLLSMKNLVLMPVPAGGGGSPGLNARKSPAGRVILSVRCASWMLNVLIP